MKTMLLKNGIFTMLMFAFILVALPSCDKDEETPEPTFKETLVGTWDIDSYLLDDDEWIGFILDEASITFQENLFWLTSHSPAAIRCFGKASNRNFHW